MNNKRSLQLNSKVPATGQCVIYCMSRDQRVRDNHPLLTAQSTALELGLPLIVVFNLLPNTGVRSKEHYEFMLSGLRQVADDLAKLNIPFVLLSGTPTLTIQKLVKDTSCAHLYFDFSPFRGTRKTQKKIAYTVACPCTVVDTHNIIPLWVLSDKEEFAAHTIRNKVHKNLAEWLSEPETLKTHPYTITTEIESLSWEDAKQKLDNMKSSGINPKMVSGEKYALARLQLFVQKGLSSYATDRNIPTTNGQSELSPYLHFGQISSLRVALELVKVSTEPPLLLRMGKLASYDGVPTIMDSINALLEELIVRKELADNYCFYNADYDSLQGAKPWAIKTLEEHSSDPRDFIYTLTQWENATTHDKAWNAAQNELMKTGKMHGYMRMYWAKKILEWSSTHEEALETAIYLNDHYSIDGGDPNGYTGIMWSIAGIHDRPWFERSVYGKIRYMNSGGLERKFKLDEYIDLWTK